jgi:hypothetical protein
MPAHLLCGIGNSDILTDIEQCLGLILNLLDFSYSRYEHFFASQKIGFTSNKPVILSTGGYSMFDRFIGATGPFLPSKAAH